MEKVPSPGQSSNRLCYDHEKTEMTGNQHIDPIVSVVIPVYNRTEELKRAISSVLNQTFQNFELLIVDDGSDDDIKSVCNFFGDPRIKYIRNDEHVNANKARNTGILQSRGVYIAMLDSDDEFLSCHLERRLIKMKEWGCEGIFGSAYIVDEIGKRLQISRPMYPGEKMVDYLLSDGFAATPTHFYNLQAVKDILWDDTFECHQDFDFSIRFSEKYRFVSDFEPTVVVHWEKKELNISNLDSCLKFIEKYRSSISPKNYCNYHRGMYYLMAFSGDRKYVKHFARNSYKYIREVSFNDFLFVHGRKRKYKVSLLIKFFLLHIYYFLRK